MRVRLPSLEESSDDVDHEHQHRAGGEAQLGSEPAADYLLTRCRNALTNFAGTEADDPLQFLYLTEFSRRRFINCQVQLTTPEMMRTFKAPVDGPGSLIWRTCAYRADNVYLAFLPLDTSTNYVLIRGVARLVSGLFRPRDR